MNRYVGACADAQCAYTCAMSIATYKLMPLLQYMSARLLD